MNSRRSIDRLFDASAASASLNPIDFFGRESVLNAESQVIMRVVGEGDEKRILAVKSRSPKSPADIANLDAYLGRPPVRYDDQDKMRDEQGSPTVERVHKSSHLVITSGNEDDEELLQFLDAIMVSRADALANRSSKELEQYKEDALVVATVRAKADRIEAWKQQGVAGVDSVAIDTDDVEIFKLVAKQDKGAMIANYDTALKKNAQNITQFIVSHTKSLSIKQHM